MSGVHEHSESPACLPAPFAAEATRGDTRARSTRQQAVAGSKLVAVLDDETDEVGQVHVGLVHLLQLDDPEVQRNEAAITDLRFLSTDDLRRSIDEYEGWSRMCIHGLQRILLEGIGEKAACPRDSVEEAQLGLEENSEVR